MSVLAQIASAMMTLIVDDLPGVALVVKSAGSEVRVVEIVDSLIV